MIGKKTNKKILLYAVLCLIGVVMAYPLVWLISASFKTNAEIFGSFSLIPKSFSLESFKEGWQGSGQYTFGTFFLNTFYLVIPTIAFTIVSSTIVAYGFARFDFPLKKILFVVMLSTMMLPDAVIMIPRYILFNKFGWINSYKPWIVPAMFAGTPFFIFMMVQFFRGLPKELDESAIIDGCSKFGILIRILLPLCKPALFSMGIFMFIWTWNDFFNSLIYINSIKKFTVALGLRMSLDTTGGAIGWAPILAMSFLAVIPPLLIFFFAQKHFVEGIATAGIKS